MKSNFWLRILAPVLVLILGIVLFFTVGFNKSLELSGYHLIEVNTGNYEISEALNKIDEVLKDKDLSVREKYIKKDDYGDVIAVKFTTKIENTDSLEQNIKNELIESFGYDQDSLLEQTYIKVSGYIEPQNMTMTFLTTALRCRLRAEKHQKGFRQSLPI